MLRKYILPVIIIVLLCLSFIAGFRIDLTQEKRHSISDFTKDYFTENKNDINVTVYLHGDDLPVVYKKLSQSVIELLNELKSYSGNRLSYTLINPTASEDKNERMEFFKKLAFKGMMPRNARVSGREGESVEKIVYPYALVKIGKKEVTVNLLQNDPRLEWESEENINNSVQALEFEIMDAISKVSGKNKPRIAFLEGHGELHEKQVYDITNSLSEYYNVDRGVIGGTSGLIDNYECLIIAKPTKPFDEKDKFIIDQYIMNGGKVLWLFDPIYTNVDSFAVQPSTTAIANRLNIEDQLFKYGVRVNTDLIQDLNCAPIGLAANIQGKSRIKLFPWYYYPLIVSDNSHPINKYLDFVRTEFISSISLVGKNNSVKKTVLLSSSIYSKSLPTPLAISLQEAQLSPEREKFASKNKPFAVLMEGIFPSVFRYRKPPVKPHKPVQDSSVNTKMIVVSDGDIIKNEFAENGKPQKLGWDVHSKRYFGGNTAFIVNSVNYLCDNSGLMDLRNRELRLRLLDKKKIINDRIYFQVLNLVLPIIILSIFGIIFNIIRRRRYR